jgi:hypothetical protein
MAHSRIAALMLAAGLILMFLGVGIVTTGGDSDLNEILFVVGLLLAVGAVVITLRRATADG